MLRRYLDADDDWIETFRRVVYPAMHPYLVHIGKKFGLSLYSIGDVGESQYVDTVYMTEERLEEVLVDKGFTRNPIACFKHLSGSRLASSGSWRLTHHDAPELVEPGMQLHLTLFDRKEVYKTAVYAHYEHDWVVSPWKHLRGIDLSVEKGVEKARETLFGSTDGTKDNK